MLCHVLYISHSQISFWKKLLNSEIMNGLYSLKNIRSTFILVSYPIKGHNYSAVLYWIQMRPGRFYLTIFFCDTKVAHTTNNATTMTAVRTNMSTARPWWWRTVMAPWYWCILKLFLLSCVDLIGSKKMKRNTQLFCQSGLKYFSVFKEKEQPDQTELDWDFFWQCAPILRRRRSPPAPWCSSRRLRSNSSRCRGVVGCVCHFRFTKKKILSNK